MHSEDNFQNRLDEEPKDHATREVLGDFLEENNDPRANGYRALGRLRKRPVINNNTREGHTPMWEWLASSYQRPPYKPSVYELPDDWHQLIEDQAEDADDGEYDGGFFRQHPTRKDAEDRAALAFSKLPHQRQQQLLGLDTTQLLSRLTSRRRYYKHHADN